MLREMHCNSAAIHGTFPKLGARCQIGEAVASRERGGGEAAGLDRSLASSPRPARNSILMTMEPSIAILDAGSTPLPNREVRREGGVGGEQLQGPHVAERELLHWVSRRFDGGLSKTLIQQGRPKIVAELLVTISGSLGGGGGALRAGP